MRAEDVMTRLEAIKAKQERGEELTQEDVEFVRELSRRMVETWRPIAQEVGRAFKRMTEQIRPAAERLERVLSEHPEGRRILRDAQARTQRRSG